MKGLVTGLSSVMVVCVLASGTAWGQATAQVSGTVRDSSGAVLPGVEITATQTETGIARSTVTNETGFYVLAAPEVLHHRGPRPAAAAAQRLLGRRGRAQVQGRERRPGRHPGGQRQQGEGRGRSPAPQGGGRGRGRQGAHRQGRGRAQRRDGRALQAEDRGRPARGRSRRPRVRGALGGRHQQGPLGASEVQALVEERYQVPGTKSKTLPRWMLGFVRGAGVFSGGVLILSLWRGRSPCRTSCGRGPASP
ncbi:MAG: carboxypeptidase regulatory-like domain-containing protein [Planctomycetes bacterium]|nr:carboxypeptidase regulatory-like domain-containing protein [Planctomycetota bacterium]